MRMKVSSRGYVNPDLPLVAGSGAILRILLNKSSSDETCTEIQLFMTMEETPLPWY